MKKIIIYSTLVIGFYSVYGQTEDINTWRDSGYQAKMIKDYQKSDRLYQLILKSDSTDYDARLALGKLFVLDEDYLQAISVFNKIYSNDTTDVEALNGLGRCFLKLGKDSLSAQYFEKALGYLPGEISQYLYLAEAYGNDNRMEKAIKVYEKANSVDNTYSEVWAGIGKMYFWLDKPVTSSRFYRKAMELDPQNTAIKSDSRKIKQETAWNVSLRVGPIQEKEESYTINAIITRLSIGKRFTDHFRVTANFLLDHSDRVYSNDVGDTIRWYNSSWIKAEYLTNNHTLSIYGGYSNTDNRISNYGLLWNLNYPVGKFVLKNSLQAGYDYYYYWNHVGATSATDQFSALYKFVELNGLYSYGFVNPVYCLDNSNPDTGYVRRNPYQSYSASLVFKVLKRPDIRISITHSFLDYTYKSPLYYSPDNRQLTGPGISIYYNISHFYCYGSFSYKIGNEYSFGERMKVNNWTSSLELGYDLGLFSFSVSEDSFYNPFYQSISVYASVKALF